MSKSKHQSKAQDFDKFAARAKRLDKAALQEKKQSPNRQERYFTEPPEEDYGLGFDDSQFDLDS